MRAKRAIEFHVFLKHTNIFQFCNINNFLEQKANEDADKARMRAKRVSEFRLFLRVVLGSPRHSPHLWFIPSAHLASYPHLT